MRRAALIAVVAIAVLLSIAGTALSRRATDRVSLDAWARRLGEPRPLAPSELGDAGHCVIDRSVHLGRSCTLSAPPTWSFRRRALVLVKTQGVLAAEVTPDGHPERAFRSSFEENPTSLPVDRAGATIVLSCAPGPPCAATIR
jgi:hypothetical protein